MALKIDTEVGSRIPPGVCFREYRPPRMPYWSDRHEARKEPRVTLLTPKRQTPSPYHESAPPLVNPTLERLAMADFARSFRHPWQSPWKD